MRTVDIYIYTVYIYIYIKSCFSHPMSFTLFLRRAWRNWRSWCLPESSRLGSACLSYWWSNPDDWHKQFDFNQVFQPLDDQAQRDEASFELSGRVLLQQTLDFRAREEVRNSKGLQNESWARKRCWRWKLCFFVIHLHPFTIVTYSYYTNIYPLGNEVMRWFWFGWSDPKHPPRVLCEFGSLYLDFYHDYRIYKHADPYPEISRLGSLLIAIPENHRALPHHLIIEPQSWSRSATWARRAVASNCRLLWHLTELEATRELSKCHMITQCPNKTHWIRQNGGAPKDLQVEVPVRWLREAAMFAEMPWLDIPKILLKDGKVWHINTVT